MKAGSEQLNIFKLKTSFRSPQTFFSPFPHDEPDALLQSQRCSTAEQRTGHGPHLSFQCAGRGTGARGDPQGERKRKSRTQKSQSGQPGQGTIRDLFYNSLIAAILIPSLSKRLKNQNSLWFYLAFFFLTSWDGRSPNSFSGFLRFSISV